MKIVVDVTRKDIKGAQRGVGNFCPVARALKRKFNTKKVWVMGQLAEINDEWYTLSTPGKRKVEAYDEGKPFPVGKIVLTSKECHS